MIGLNHYLVLAAFVFCSGVFVMITKRNAIGILIGVEMILNAGSLNLVAFSVYRAGDMLAGQVMAVFIIVLAAAETAIAIAICVNFYNLRATVDVDRADELKG